MRYVVDHFNTYENIYNYYTSCTTVDIVPIRKGDEVLFFKTPDDVVKFVIRWDERHSYMDSTDSFAQPVVQAKESAFVPMVRVSSLEFPPILYLVLCEKEETHPIYGPYIGWGIEHTNSIRRMDRDVFWEIKKQKL